MINVDRLHNLVKALDIRFTDYLEAEARSVAETVVEPTVEPTKTLQDYILNQDQQDAVDLAMKGESFVLTGSAGTGKTLTVNAIANARMSCNRDINPHPLPITTFRDPRGTTKEQESKPAIAFVAFTNRAVNNMANNLRTLSPELMDDLQGNFMTIHKLLEVCPEYYFDAESGKDKMRFSPLRTAHNRIPIKTLVIEEASMVDVHGLWKWLYEALEPNTQVILLGDLNQLPPPFGDSILNYALKQLPIIELTHVYRQALDSPIIRQMYQVLKGKAPITDTNDFIVVHGNKDKPVGVDRMGLAVSNILSNLYDAGTYDPSSDIILSPFNKHGCGTIILNKLISTFLDKKMHALGTPRKVYEIQAGICKCYYAVGDLIYDGQSKMQGYISNINLNGGYFGAEPLEASTELSRFGFYTGEEASNNIAHNKDSGKDYSYSVLDLDVLANASVSEAEKKILASSHCIEVTLEDGSVVERSTAGEINAMDFGYALTAHKAQGCEWRSVFIILHKSHFIANREWLYTAGTRAKECCTIIAREDVLQAAVNRQRIKGDSLDAKVAAFNEKLEKKEAKARLDGIELDTITFDKRS